MDKLKRQERYIVVKLTDLAGCSGDICPSTGMSEAEIALRNHLASWHVPTRHCVVVERDWPEYESVWRMIEDRVSRAALSPAEQPGLVVPEVAGIGRDADHSRAVVLYLRKEPNNDDIRAIQEALRVARKTYMALAALSPAEQPGQVVPEEWRAGVLAVATMVEKKADNYAAEFGSVDMGALSFGIGHRADIKRDHYHSLVELADEIRALLASAQPQGGEA